LQNFVICLEMLVLGYMHHIAFGVHDFYEPGKGALLAAEGEGEPAVSAGAEAPRVLPKVRSAGEMAKVRGCRVRTRASARARASGTTRVCASGREARRTCARAGRRFTACARLPALPPFSLHPPNRQVIALQIVPASELSDETAGYLRSGGKGVLNALNLRTKGAGKAGEPVVPGEAVAAAATEIEEVVVVGSAGDELGLGGTGEAKVGR